MSHIAHSLLQRRRSEPLCKRSKFNKRVYSMAKGSSQITSFSERASALGQCRNLKMAGSAHAYVRGNTQKFYEWLAASDSSKVPQGPPIWICGDCHVGNLGPIADTGGSIDIEIRGLALAPCLIGKRPESLAQRDRRVRILKTLFREVLPRPLDRLTHHNLDAFRAPAAQVGVRVRERFLVPLGHLFEHLGRGHARQVRAAGGHRKRQSEADEIVCGIADYRLIEIANLDID